MDEKNSEGLVDLIILIALLATFATAAYLLYVGIQNPNFIEARIATIVISFVALYISYKWAYHR
jgi:hypothetical protein